jgi:hypothetical protein
MLKIASESKLFKKCYLVPSGIDYTNIETLYTFSQLDPWKHYMKVDHRSLRIHEIRFCDSWTLV